MTAIRFYGAPISPFSMRVFMQIAAKGLDIPMLSAPGGVHSDEYRAIAPMGKIPVLETESGRLAESEVICEHLEDLYPSPSLRPADPWARAQVRLVSRVLDTYVMNPMLPLFVNFDANTRNRVAVDAALAAVAQGLRWLDGGVAPGPYAVGNALTLADCAAVPILLFVERFPPMFGLEDPFARCPTVAAYWVRVRHDPVVRRVVGIMQDGLAAV